MISEATTSENTIEEKLDLNTKSSFPRYIFPKDNLKVPEGNLEKAQQMNCLYDCLWLVGVWADHCQTTSNSLDTDQSLSLTGQIIATLADWALLLRNIDNPKDIPNNIRIEELNSKLDGLKDTLGISNPIQYQQELGIERVDQDWEFIYPVLSGLAHDLFNPLCSLKLWQDLSVTDEDKQSFAKVILSETEKIKSNISEAAIVLSKQEFKQESLLARDIQETIFSVLKTTIGDELVFTVEGLSPDQYNLSINFSKLELKRYVWNLISNSKKAYQGYNQLDTDDRLVRGVLSTKTDEGGVLWLVFTFDDWGPGYPPKIIQMGNFDGQSRWRNKDNLGAGVGMRYHKGVIEKYYGGLVMLGNNPDSISGARTKLLLPIVSLNGKKA